MTIHKLIEYSDDYMKAPGSLWQYYGYKPTLINVTTNDDFPGNNA